MARVDALQEFLDGLAALTLAARRHAARRAGDTGTVRAIEYASPGFQDLAGIAGFRVVLEGVQYFYDGSLSSLNVKKSNCLGDLPITQQGRATCRAESRPAGLGVLTAVV